MKALTTLLTVATAATILVNISTYSIPLPMGEGNRYALRQAYLQHQYRGRYAKYMDTVTSIYAQEEARKACKAWRVYPESEYAICVRGVTKAILKNFKKGGAK